MGQSGFRRSTGAERLSTHCCVLWLCVREVGGPGRRKGQSEKVWKKKRDRALLKACPTNIALNSFLASLLFFSVGLATPGGRGFGRRVSNRINSIPQGNQRSAAYVEGPNGSRPRAPFGGHGNIAGRCNGREVMFCAKGGKQLAVAQKNIRVLAGSSQGLEVARRNPRGLASCSRKLTGTRQHHQTTKTCDGLLFVAH
jgi:hypothetical protein